MKVGTDGILLGAWADVDGCRSALDIGTGTGLVALMLAQRGSQLQTIDAVEIEERAFKQAADNIRNSPWQDRTRIFHTAVQDTAFMANRSYDLIVSNPPYWPEESGTSSPHRARKYSRQTLSLTHEDLLACAQEMLAENGRICLILPTAAGNDILTRAERYQLFPSRLTEIKPVPYKPPHRILIQLERGKRPCCKNSLIIEKGPRHEYTETFIALTQDFYTNYPANKMT